MDELLAAHRGDVKKLRQCYHKHPPMCITVSCSFDALAGGEAHVPVSPSNGAIS